MNRWVTISRTILHTGGRRNDGVGEEKLTPDVVVLEMLRILRERYRTVFNFWVKKDYQMMIAMLKVILKDTDGLVKYLEKLRLSGGDLDGK